MFRNGKHGILQTLDSLLQSPEDQTPLECDDLSCCCSEGHYLLVQGWVEATTSYSIGAWDRLESKLLSFPCI